MKATTSAAGRSASGKKIILLIHGPNLNLIGQRDVKHYGSLTLPGLVGLVKSYAKKSGYSIKDFQSNHEGALIDFLQKNRKSAAGIIINPGALTHYSYAVYDGLLDTKLPVVEVHLSDLKNREEFRRISVTAPACEKIISGKKQRGYLEAVDFLNKLLK